MAQLCATEAMCAVCFDTIIAALNHTPEAPIVEAFAKKESFADVKTPVFVTWKKNTGSGYDLRGCIGTFSADSPVREVIPSYAKISAFNDSRFPPIDASEVPQLQVAISLLTNFTPVDNPFAFEIGRHGVQLSFTVEGRRYGATFLPEVAPQQGWNQKDVIANLMRKSGFGADDYYEAAERLAPQMQTTLYESSKLAMTYEEYQAYKAAES